MSCWTLLLALPATYVASLVAALVVALLASRRSARDRIFLTQDLARFLISVMFGLAGAYALRQGRCTAIAAVYVLFGAYGLVTLAARLARMRASALR